MGVFRDKERVFSANAMILTITSQIKKYSATLIIGILKNLSTGEMEIQEP